MLQFLLPAAASVIGGLLANKSNKKAQQQQSAQEYARQKEFAQMGIQWKTQDAEKAGIHPLFGLGAQTTSYAPQSVGGGQDFSFLSDAGQNIGRAIDSTRSNPEKQLAMASSQVQLEGLRLDNDLKRAQLASAIALARQSSNPGLPGMHTTADIMGMPGQGDAPQIDADKFMPPQYTPHVHEGASGVKNTDPHWSDAQTYEDRYGEMADYVYGPRIWMSDKMQQRKNHFNKNIRPFLIMGKDGRYRYRR